MQSNTTDNDGGYDAHTLPRYQTRRFQIAAFRICPLWARNPVSLFAAMLLALRESGPRSVTFPDRKGTKCDGMSHDIQQHALAVGLGLSKA